MSPVWNYQHVTPAVFRKLQLLAKQQGFQLPDAPQGKFVIQIASCKLGFTYAWDARAGKLAIRCDSKPLLISSQMVKSYADQIVCQSGGTRMP